ncbi:MAG: macro domain-containing protein [Paraglaciecola sp.]|uniref:Macro domain-containing protein n=1 Tax=Paraglaciecola agarilytica NO2 TaxID=1125747 RepID=A0ABQ0I0M7_9ALTE|nr:macro domain-containing protein [Paraglaciecola agarilytica]GAC02870.1 hypothetical protein GAGA_0005 [Paraglaciecola agarilytica NO2]
MTEFEVILGDITGANVDAIVNAAKPSLTGGSGVDGAIHKAAGPALLQECMALKPHDGIRCPIGEARITGSGQLQCKFIIHTVGPIYKGCENPEALLTKSYTNSIELALNQKCKSIAFPAISCGKYGYPHEEAIGIAFSSLYPYLSLDIKIYFYVFEKDLYLKYLNKLSIIKKSI